MRQFLILLALSLVSSEKLDRTYLPPPGFKYAGGSPEDIQLPLEFSNKTYPVKELLQVNRPVLRDPQLLGNDSKFSIYTPDDGSPNLGRVTPETKYPKYFTETIDQDSETNVGPLNTEFDGRTQIPDDFYPSNHDETEIQQHANIPDDVFTQRPVNNILDKAPNYGYDGQSNFNQYKIDPQPILDVAPGTIQDFEVVQPFDQKQGLIKNFENNKPIYFDHQELMHVTTAPQVINSIYEPNAFGFYGGNPMLKTVEVFPEQQKVTQGAGQSSDKGNLPLYGHKNDKVSVQDILQEPFYRRNGNNADSRIVKGSDNMPSTITSTIVSVEVPIWTGLADASPPGASLSSKIYSSNKGNISPVINYHPGRLRANAESNSVIVNYKNSITPEGFVYSFDTSNGIHAEESGTAIDGVKAQGAYSYTGDDGKVYEVIYSADENGFQPRGDHLPTPPPIPEAIQRVIEQVATAKDAGVFEDGSYDEAKYGYEKYQGAMDRYNSRPFENLRSKYGQKRPISTTENAVPYNYETVEMLQKKLDNSHIGNEKRPVNRFPNKRPYSLLPQKAKEIPSQITYPQKNIYSQISELNANENPLGPLPVSSRIKEKIPDPSNNKYSMLSKGSISDSSDNSKTFKALPNKQNIFIKYDQPLPVNRIIGRDKIKIDSNSLLPEPVEFGDRKHIVIGKSNTNKHTAPSVITFNESEDPQVTETFSPNDKNIYATQDPNITDIETNFKQSVQKSLNRPHGENNEYNQEFGYQYVPPRNKFKQSRLPMTFTTQEYSATLSPVAYETVKPLATPDLYNHDDEIRDKLNNDFQLAKKPGYNNIEHETKQQSFGSNYNDKNNSEYEGRPEKQINNESITTTKFPVTGMVHLSLDRHPSSESTQTELTLDRYHDKPKGTLASEKNGYIRKINPGIPRTPASFTTTKSMQNIPFSLIQPLHESMYQTTYKPITDLDGTVSVSSLYNVKPIAGSHIYAERPDIVLSQSINKPRVSFNTLTDRIESNGALGINVDGFGRPIPTSNTRQDFFDFNTKYGNNYAKAGGAEGEDSVHNTGGITSISDTPFGSYQPFDDVNTGSGEGISEEPIRPEVPTLFYPNGVQTSTEMIIGEDFSGPKQPQRYDPETGYHYK